MKCLMLCAGYATRLYPLTENFPKPLLEVGGRSILDRLTDDISSTCKIDEFVVISNHKFADHFRHWAATRTEQVTVIDDGTETNETRLGAVKDIQYAAEQLRLDTDLLVIAADNLLEFSLSRFVEYGAEKGSSAVMRYYEPDAEKLKKCGVLTVDENDLVLAMTEKSPTPATHWCCPPFYYLTRSDACRVAEAIADGCGTDAPGSFIAWLCTHSTVHAMEMPGRRFDIGNLESYRKIQQMFE